MKILIPSSIVALTLISGCASIALSTTSPQSAIEAKFAAVNRHALDEIVNLYSPEAQITASDFCQPRHGREDVRRTYKALFDAFPNIGVEVHEYVVQGDRVAVRLNVQNKPPAAGRALAAPERSTAVFAIEGDLRAGPHSLSVRSEGWP